jgi:hypothetical protein
MVGDGSQSITVAFTTLSQCRRIFVAAAGVIARLIHNLPRPSRSLVGHRTDITSQGCIIPSLR